MFADGVVTLTSSAQGAICPGEEVTLTCTVTGEPLLGWSSAAFRNPVRYIESDPIGQVINRGIFTATLIRTPPLASLTSTLRVTATPEAMLNGTVVTCSDQFNPMSITLTLAGGLICMKVLLNKYCAYIKCIECVCVCVCVCYMCVCALCMIQKC